MKIDFTKVKEGTLEETEGILYVLTIEIDDKVIVKIGITKGSIKDRVLQISGSIYNKYRYFPKITPRKFSKVPLYKSKEKLLLAYFRDKQYVPAHKFSGSTELVDTDVEEILEVYMYLKDHGTLPNKDNKEG